MSRLEKLAEPSNGCPYLTSLEELNEISDSNISLLHLNIRSTLKNLDSFLILLDDLASKNVVVDLIVLCVTFLTKDSKSLAEINGYTSFHTVLENRPGGGVSVYVKNEIPVHEIIVSPFNDIIETIFVKISVHNFTVLVGELYRIPNTSLPEFEHSMLDVYETVKRCKNVIIGSDHNLDFLKQSNHQPTSHFVDSLMANELLSVITKPTRLSHTSSTLIDNIFIKGVQLMSFNSCVLVENVSDHFPCLYLGNISTVKNSDTVVITSRKLKDKTYDQLNERLLMFDWSPIYEMDANASYAFLI